MLSRLYQNRVEFITHLPDHQSLYFKPLRRRYFTPGLISSSRYRIVTPAYSEEFLSFIETLFNQHISDHIVWFVVLLLHFRLHPGRCSHILRIIEVFHIFCLIAFHVHFAFIQ